MKKKLYIIMPVKYRDIVEIKSFNKDHCPNMKCTADKDRVNWLNVKWIHKQRSDPRSIFLTKQVYLTERNLLK